MKNFKDILEQRGGLNNYNNYTSALANISIEKASENQPTITKDQDTILLEMLMILGSAIIFIGSLYILSQSLHKKAKS